jgi:hypothetical protein
MKSNVFAQIKLYRKHIDFDTIQFDFYKETIIKIFNCDRTKK